MSSKIEMIYWKKEIDYIFFVYPCTDKIKMEP